MAIKVQGSTVLDSDSTLHNLNIGKGAGGNTYISEVDSSNNIVIGENTWGDLITNPWGYDKGNGDGQNIIIGNLAGANAIASSFNTVIGHSALANTAESSENIVIGLEAMNNTGDNGAPWNNIAIGNWAMQNATYAFKSIGIGRYALNALTGGATNVAVGDSALQNITGGIDNVAIGHQALSSTTDVDRNTAVGRDALRSVTSDYNIGVGYASGSNFSSQYNIAMGYLAAPNMTSGGQAIAIGYNAGKGVTTGSYNIFVGAMSSNCGITTGSQNIVIGNNITGLTSNAENTIVIGTNSANRITVDSEGVVKVKTIADTVYTLTGTVLDPANGGTQTKTLSGATTFTENLSAGEAMILMLDGGATYTVTWPTITWVTSSGNAAPTLTANDTLVFWKISTTLYGAYVGSYT